MALRLTHDLMAEEIRQAPGVRQAALAMLWAETRVLVRRSSPMVPLGMVGAHRAAGLLPRTPRAKVLCSHPLALALLPAPELHPTAHAGIL